MRQYSLRCIGGPIWSMKTIGIYDARRVGGSVSVRVRHYRVGTLLDFYMICGSMQGRLMSHAQRRLGTAVVAAAVSCRSSWGHTVTTEKPCPAPPRDDRFPCAYRDERGVEYDAVQLPTHEVIDAVAVGAVRRTRPAGRHKRSSGDLLADLP